MSDVQNAVLSPKNLVLWHDVRHATHVLSPQVQGARAEEPQSDDDDAAEDYYFRQGCRTRATDNVRRELADQLGSSVPGCVRRSEDLCANGRPVAQKECGQRGHAGADEDARLAAAAPGVQVEMGDKIVSCQFV